MPDYGIPLFTKIGVRTTDSGILDVPYNSFYGLHDRDYLTNTVDTFTFDFEHRFSDNLILRNVTRYSETLNDYVVTNPGDGGAAQLIGGEWWMKRGTKSRWNPVTTIANVTDLSGSFTAGGMKHAFDIGLELSREENSNAAYSTFTTSGAPARPASSCRRRTCQPRRRGLHPRLCAVDRRRLDRGDQSRPDQPQHDGHPRRLCAGQHRDLTEPLILNLGVRWDRILGRGRQRLGHRPTAVPQSGTRRSPCPSRVGLRQLPDRPGLQADRGTPASTSPTPPPRPRRLIAAGDQNTRAARHGQSGRDGRSRSGRDHQLGDRRQGQSVRRPSGVVGGGLHADPRERPDPGRSAAHRLRPGRRGRGAGDRAGRVRQHHPRVAGVRRLQLDGLRTGEGRLDHRRNGVTIPSAFEGLPLANTPEHSFSLFTTYRVSPKLSLGGGVYYVAKSFGGNQGGAGGGANRVYAPEYTRVDLFASYDINDTASLQLNVQNAGDEEYIMRTNGVHHADVAPARQAILTLNLRY
jgi:catecholate siderophore receptor